jgi:two-component system, NtrC family, nitrogen regulation sensor histidine kinase NtrY
LGYRRTLLFFTLVLSIAASIYAVLNSRTQFSSAHQVERITSRLADYLKEVNLELDRQETSVKLGKGLMASTIPCVLLHNDTLRQWTDNHFIPPIKALTEDFEMSVIKISSGDVLAVKRFVRDEEYIIAITPLHIQYKITNSYLPSYWNTHVFDRPLKSVLESEAIDGYPIVINQQTLFRVSFSSEQRLSRGNWNYLVVLFLSITLGCICLIITPWFLEFSKSSPGIGFIVLAGVLISLRIGMLLGDFPSKFLDWNLFDPKSFASSEFNPSLGDLFLNSILVLVLCLYLLFRYKYVKAPSFIRGIKIWYWIFSSFYVLAILFGFLYLFVVIQTIYNNSTLSFSLYHSLPFDSLRIVAILVLVLSGVSIFMFTHVFVRLLVVEQNWISTYLSMCFGVALFIIINTLSQQIFISSLVICLIYLIAVFALKLHSSLARLQFLSFAYLFVCVIALSINGVIAIDYFEEKRAANNQFSFAENILSERDYFGEYLLQESASKIARDAFVQTRMASPFLSKEPVKQKIRQVLLSGYFSRYSVKVLLFNASGEPLSNSEPTTFFGWSKMYDTETFKTEYKNVFYIANESTDFAPKYLTFIPIFKNNSPLGFIVLELSLKRIIPENVYPELLVDNRFQRSNNNSDLSYALITGEEVKYSTGNFHYHGIFKTLRDEELVFTSGYVYKEYLHVGVKDHLGRIVIVSSSVKGIMSWVVNFSFLLLLGLLIISIVILAYWLFIVSKTEQLNLATRIQLILNLAFFIPLVLVSIVTLGLTTRSVQNQLDDEYLNKVKQIAPALAEATLADSRDEGEDFDATFTSIVNRLNVDANLFALDGKLITSSQPLIFDNQLLSPYINPEAINNIRNGENLFILNEKVGGLNFSVAYAILQSPETGKQLGIIGVPFFQSVSSLEKLQVTVLGNILSIFTLVFIVLVFISFIVTKWLTSPLQFITNTLGKISLTRENKPLQWSANDEVGMMVKQYNSMLEKLEASKRELELNQREQAWREIAQQVAHEIKNPLTPMKLTLQQLERSVESGTEQNEKLKNSIASLLTNLNALNDIASSFSSFAKMPTPVMSKVDVVKLLWKAVTMFKEEYSISLATGVEEAYIKGDEKLLNRVFVNLLLNSIQAANLHRPLTIQIKLEQVADYYRITFSDNGKGIEDSLKDKIFLPHFTTKKSGSGLGLAIAKESITQMGGVIYFETSTEGTHFFIELKQI